MVANSQTAHFISRYAHNASATISSILTVFGVKALASAKSTLKSLQTARMVSVLASMTDVELAQIGITRSEIPPYAAKLMSDE